MFALVRFLNEYDKEPYEVPVEDVKDFSPANENDFDRNKVYSTFWKDSGAPENTGLYPSQVLLLAASKEGLRAKRSSRRVAKPVIHPSDIEVEENDRPNNGSAKQSSKQGSKSRPNAAQLAAKKEAYQGILERYQAHEKKNDAISSSQAPRKRRQCSTSESESSTDELISASELKRAQLEAKHWRRRFDEVMKEKRQLQDVIMEMKDAFSTKLDTIVQMLEERREKLPQDEESHPGLLPENHLDEEEPLLLAAAADMSSAPRAPEVPRAPVSAGAPADPNAQVPSTPETTAPEDEPRAIMDPRAAERAPFSDIGGGRYHVKAGLVIGSKQAEKILLNKKPALVAKDMAQAVWGRKGLAERTYGGKLAPKDQKKEGAVARKQLSPEKVAVVIETVTHWGMKTGLPVKETVDNISTVLSQKIQDLRKSLKKKL